MDTAEQWLLIINSVMLAIFLVLSIILLIKALQVIGDIKRLSKKADDVATNVQNAANNFQKFAPLAGIASMFYQAKKRSQKGGNDER